MGKNGKQQEKRTFYGVAGNRLYAETKCYFLPRRTRREHEEHKEKRSATDRRAVMSAKAQSINRLDRA